MKIQVNDRVKWLHSFQALNQQCFGHVVSTDSKVMGNPCFLIQSSIDNRQVMVSQDKVTKAQDQVKLPNRHLLHFNDRAKKENENEHYRKNKRSNQA